MNAPKLHKQQTHIAWSRCSNSNRNRHDKSEKRVCCQKTYKHIQHGASVSSKYPLPDMLIKNQRKHMKMLVITSEVGLRLPCRMRCPCSYFVNLYARSPGAHQDTGVVEVAYVRAANTSHWHSEQQPKRLCDQATSQNRESHWPAAAYYTRLLDGVAAIVDMQRYMHPPTEPISGSSCLQQHTHNRSNHW